MLRPECVYRRFHGERKGETLSWKTGNRGVQSQRRVFNKFKNRQNIFFRRKHGESASVSDDTCSEWKEKLKTLLADYEQKYVFGFIF